MERKGEVLEFHYEPNGENISTNREDDTTFGTLIAILQDRRAREDHEFNTMILGRDPLCTGHRILGTDEGLR